MSEEIAVGQTPAIAPEQLEGQVLAREGLLLRRLARSVSLPNVIVELGSYTGKSTCCLAVGSAEGQRARVYAIDLWTTGTYDENRRFYQYDPASSEPQQNSKFSRQPALDLFNERRALYDPAGLIHPITGLTTKIAEVFDQPVGLLFIDADHTYEAVKADFEAWAPKVVPGGVIALHDYAGKPEDHGVKRFVEELLAAAAAWYRLAHIVDSMCILEKSAA